MICQEFGLMLLRLQMSLLTHLIRKYHRGLLYLRGTLDEKRYLRVSQAPLRESMCINVFGMNKAGYQCNQDIVNYFESMLSVSGYQSIGS
jgi:hypothetical protein